MAFKKFILGFEPRIAKNLIVKTQTYEQDSGVFDLVCFDSLAHPIIIVESKFWAGLTENQPLSYLKHLPPNIPSILLFIAPERRLESLWSELLSRCKDNSLSLQQGFSSNNFYNYKINEFHSLALSSWNSLLDSIINELDQNNDTVAKGDVLQLKGLCSKMDSDAFLPIKSNEISPGIAKRNMQFSALVDDIIFAGVKKNLCSTNSGKLKTTTGPNHYGRYFKLGGYYCCALKFDNTRWGQFRNTPLWLEVYGKEWGSKNERYKTRQALASLETQNPSRLLFIDELPVIPLKIPLGVTRDLVLQSLLDELDSIYQLLNKNYPN